MSSESQVYRLPIYTALVSTIVVIPAIMDPINLPKLWVLSTGAVVCIAFLAKNVLNSWKDINQSLLLFSFLFLLGLFASSVASPQGIYRTFFGVWGRNNGALTFACLLVFFLFMAVLTSSQTPKFLVVTLINLGVAGTIYGLIQNAGGDPISWNNPGNKIILTLGNSDFASALLALSGIATLTMILNSSITFLRRAPLVVIFISELYLTHKSEAIQGFIVLIIGSFILIGFFLSLSSHRKLKILSFFWWGLFTTVGFFGTFGIFGIGPLSKFLNPNLRALEDRFYHWVAAGNMLKENILFGVGIDSFGDFYRRARVVEAIELRGTALTGTNNAHNSIMQMGATGGLVMLIPYLMLLAFIGYRGFLALRTHEDKVIVSGIFAIWIAFQIQSLVSIDQIGLVVWGWIAGGCLVGISNKGSNVNLKKDNHRGVNKSFSRKNSFGKLVVAILLIGGFTPSLILVSSMWGELKIRNQIVKLVTPSSNQVQSQNADELFNIAKDSKQPELRLQTLQYLLQSGSNETALKLAIATARDFPESFEAWDAVAQIYEGLGQKSAAVEARKKTIYLDPLNEELRKLLTADRASN